MDMEPAILAMPDDAGRGTGQGIEATDDEIVARVLAGDAQAFRPLVERHYPRALRYAMRMLGDRADAEDALQDAFARAYRSLSRYEARDRFGSWLLSIVVNRCRTSGRRRDRRERTFVPYDVMDDFEAGSEDGSAASRVEVQRALALLDEDEREALLLKYLDEHTYEEIAVLTGAGVSALKMRVKRARERLQALLGRHYR
jgi:RNA polymerase sigma-70 factor (ECF subfamily)